MDGLYGVFNQGIIESSFDARLLLVLLNVWYFRFSFLSQSLSQVKAGSDIENGASKMRFIDHDAHLVKLLTLCAAAPENFPAFCVIWVTHHPKIRAKWWSAKSSPQKSRSSTELG